VVGTIIGITRVYPVEEKKLRSYPQQQRTYQQLKINTTHRLKLKQPHEFKKLKTLITVFNLS
jgi:hypothetical protein